MIPGVPLNIFDVQKKYSVFSLFNLSPPLFSLKMLFRTEKKIDFRCLFVARVNSYPCCGQHLLEIRRWAFRFLVLWRWSLPIIFALLLHLGWKKQGNLAVWQSVCIFTRKGFYRTFYIRNSCVYSVYIYISAGSGHPPLSSSNHQDDIITWLLGEPKENL